MLMFVEFPGASLMEITQTGYAVTIKCPGCQATYAFDINDPDKAGRVTRDTLAHEGWCKILKKINRAIKRSKKA